MFDLDGLTIRQLLSLNSRILVELRKREILRSSNKPTGDLAEYIFCRAFKWTQQNNSQSGYDALDEGGNRYQIKARQVFKNTPSERQLSAIRGLENKNFDFLAGVLFDSEYNVIKAAIVPHFVIALSNPHYSSHDNKHTFFLKDTVWKNPHVRDVTSDLAKVCNDF